MCHTTHCSASHQTAPSNSAVRFEKQAMGVTAFPSFVCGTEVARDASTWFTHDALTHSLTSPGHRQRQNTSIASCAEWRLCSSKGKDAAEVVRFPSFCIAVDASAVTSATHCLARANEATDIADALNSTLQICSTVVPHSATSVH